jgi:hypothetical protein
VPRRRDVGFPNKETTKAAHNVRKSVRLIREKEFAGEAMDADADALRAAEAAALAGTRWSLAEAEEESAIQEAQHRARHEHHQNH